MEKKRGTDSYPTRIIELGNLWRYLDHSRLPGGRNPDRHY